METGSARALYEFGEYRLDPVKRLLLRDGAAVPLLPKALEMLLVLVEERGRVLEKEELMTRLWPDTIVEEANLSVTMSALRKALGESAQEHRYIVTIPRRGYRFVAEVSEVAETEATLIVEQHEVARVVIEQEIETERAGERESGRVETMPLLPRSPALPLSLSLLATSVVLLALVVAFGAWWVRRDGLAGRAVKSLAVLPLKPLVADSRDEYLQMGMADVLITRLSNLKHLVVRPTSAVRKYIGLEQDSLAVGRELKVDAVLDSNFQRVGDRVRVTARLVNTEDGATLWAGTFDEKFTDIFRVQDQLSEKLAGALALKLSGEQQQRWANRGTENSEAFQAYMKGRYFWAKWSEPSLRKSVEYFEQALAADPNYALAHSGLADAWNLLGYLGFVPPREAFPKSEAAARQALKLDDALGEAHHALSKTKLFYDWDWAGFERESQRTLELIPNFADAHGMLATYLTAMGRFDEAIAARRRSLELDPSSPLYTTMVGWPYFYARRYDEAITWYQKALELDPNFSQPHGDIGLCLLRQGKYDQAINELLKSRSLAGVRPETIEALRQAYAARGIKGFWQQDLEFTLEQMKQQRVRPWRVAGIYHALGDREQTFAWLEKAYAERDGLLPFLKVMPQYEDLHDDPRFANLLRRVGLTQ